jgi:hypothetical protein
MEAVRGRIILDEHVASVVEFIERNLPADRLEYVATRLPAVAQVLWAQDRCGLLERIPLSETQSAASELSLAAPYAGDDSAAVVDIPVRK